MRTHPLTRLLLPAALTLALAGTAIAAPPEKENPLDKETAAQQATPPLPPQSRSTDQPTAQSSSPISETDRMKSEFNARDANMDGYIDKTEAKQDKDLYAQFNALDTNKDGKLSASEFMNAKNIAKLPKPKTDTTQQ